MTHTPQSLLKRKAITIQDLLIKVENEDWHGVADAAMDLREIDAMLKVLETIPKIAPKPLAIQTYSSQPCGCDPGADWICEQHRNKVFAELIRAD
jgi:hypothetical protein